MSDNILVDLVDSGQKYGEHKLLDRRGEGSGYIRVSQMV